MIIGQDSRSGFANFIHRFAGGEFKQEFINISLGVVAGTILLSIILSVIFPPSGETEEEKLIKTLDPDSDNE